MSSTTTKVRIRILESDANRRGDLFCRLMGDLFFALGYEEPRFNIHKTGREVDISAKHRAEPRRLIAECKATGEKVGGDEINKFVGALDVERRKLGQPVSGYYVSLSGFTETAVEQELEAGGERITLLTESEVIEELIRGRILAALPTVMLAVGGLNSNNLTPLTEIELLAHPLGWFWGIRLGNGDVATDVAFIHADGHAIPETIIRSITAADKRCGGWLERLHCLNRSARSSVYAKDILPAKKAYLAYLKSECGEVQLEGLPADQHTGYRRLSLESIFVPVHVAPLEEISEATPQATGEGEGRPKRGNKKRASIGSVLKSCSRIALLASPGSGKSTLVKRLATAYAFPGRRQLVNDALPKFSWFPILIRCRHVSFSGATSLTSIVHEITTKKAEMDENKSRAFKDFLDDGLRNGNILLLIDGLDEIGDERQRLEFAFQLRTFLATYPKVAVVVTSREAGFRIIGRSLISACKHYRLAEFDNDDITRLTLAWHKEVVGPSDAIKRDATNLARDIIRSDRVRRLATNPLLLTTLLLVRRWIGQLPTRRSVLYGKAIEVLLMTWNVEAHKPISPDEAIPQLAYVACEMMRQGTTRVTAPKLKECLHQARNDLPEILGYTNTAPDEFISRVELRSSLLIQSGLEYESGNLVPVYEFQHLTFQEYLAAQAIIEGYYPNRSDNDTPLTILAPRFLDDKWSEVIPLAAVLAGRQAREIVGKLISLCDGESQAVTQSGGKTTPLIRLLGACLLDEVQLPPEMVETAMDVLIHRGMSQSFLYAISQGRFAQIARARCEAALLASSDNRVMDLCKNLFSLDAQDTIVDPNVWFPRVRERFLRKIDDADVVSIATAEIYAMEFFYSAFVHKKKFSQGELELVSNIGNQLVAWVYSNDPRVFVSAIWALAWLGSLGVWSHERSSELMNRVVELWMTRDFADIRHVCSWVIWTFPILSDREKSMIAPSQEVHEFLKAEFERSEPSRYRNANSKNRGCLVASFYAGGPWSKEELVRLTVEIETSKEPGKGTYGEIEFFERFLPVLGSVGVQKLSEIKSDLKKKVEQS